MRVTIEHGVYSLVIEVKIESIFNSCGYAGNAGLTTLWRGLTSRVLICYASHETEGVGRL